jgi:NADPH:quinone reductase-like Zn-dependent oxidoreductase
MKAIVYHSYGSADVLRLEEIAKPSPKDDEVLIKVHAVALNPLDWRMMKGIPLIFRKMMKVRRPTVDNPVGIGRDVAGVIEAIGRKVTQFKVGDEVFGTCGDAVAEYVCAKQSRVVAKPEAVTFEQAAALPVAGLTALQGLRKARICPGKKVLVNGASGGVGTFAVQIAKAFRAEVTGVCRPANFEMVQSIGADKVIDYTRDDFTKSAERYDIIFDCVGNKPFSQCRSIMNVEGRFLGIGAAHDVSMIEIIATLAQRMALSLFSRKKALSFIAKSSQSDLRSLGELVEFQKIAPVIDRRYTLAETPEAIRYLAEGHARGKVIIDVTS